VCAAIAGALFSPADLITNVLIVIGVAAMAVVITLRSLARWRDKRFQPIAGAVICVVWGVVILGVAVWIKIA
jgi:uncharacterized membrane protein YadS